MRDFWDTLLPSPESELQRPPGQLLEMMSLPTGGWTRSPVGSRAATFLQDEWVLQRRAPESLERAQLTLTLAHLSSEPGLGGLCFPKPIYIRGRDGFRPIREEEGAPACHEWWLAQPRLPGRVFTGLEPGWEEAASRAFPQLLRALTRLWAEPVPLRLWLVNPPTRSLHMHTAEREWLLAYLQAVWPEASRLASRLPLEKTSRVVLAHGDPILRNLIFLPNGGVELVDWEMLSPLPLASELFHWYSYLLSCTENSLWPEQVAAAWRASRALLEGEGWREEDFLFGLAWYVIRDVLASPSPREPASLLEGLSLMTGIAAH